jgi:hypothetical protein
LYIVGGAIDIHPATSVVDVFDFETKSVYRAKKDSGDDVVIPYPEWSLACTIVESEHTMVITGSAGTNRTATARFDIDTM